MKTKKIMMAVAAVFISMTMLTAQAPAKKECEKETAKKECCEKKAADCKKDKEACKDEAKKECCEKKATAENAKKAECCSKTTAAK